MWIGFEKIHLYNNNKDEKWTYWEYKRVECKIKAYFVNGINDKNCCVQCYATLKMKNAFSVLLTHTSAHVVKCIHTLIIFSQVGWRQRRVAEVTARDNTIPQYRHHSDESEWKSLTTHRVGVVLMGALE